MNMKTKRDFADELKLSYAMRGKVPPTAAVLSRWWELIGHYPVDLIIAAIKEHDRVSQYAAQPADIIKLLDTMDGRPGPEEAWGLVLKSADELETVVWTDEILEARSACENQLLAGDTIAARKAFLEKYEKTVAEARRAFKRARWLPSYGACVDRRASAISRAIATGKLKHEPAGLMLENRSQTLAALTDQSKTAPEQAKKAISQLREILDKTKKMQREQAEKDRIDKENLIKELEARERTGIKIT